MQASTDGGRARYFSLSPFPNTPSNASGLPTYVSTRDGLGSWANAGVMPAASSAAQVRGFSEDLSEGVVWAEGVGPAGEELEHRTYYLHNLQVKNPTVEGFNRLYEAQEPISEAALFALGGFSGDGTRMVFESGLHLLPEAAPGQLNAYQWDAAKPPGEQLSLIGILPESEGGGPPPEGSIVGASAGASLTALQPPPAFNPGVISRDGSRCSSPPHPLAGFTRDSRDLTPSRSLRVARSSWVRPLTGATRSIAKAVPSIAMTSVAANPP